ncbi:hypothetical protein LTR56_026401 [Elasticomyces elasticus]|nr:hypothetical protein LTR56_026401 [Elasticomyces elasticus]KAK3618250.1 hypothetical protein LTR22_026438 [Elasticomyces elasticus]KAK4902425.1 hypothetical protein LTR49_027055 [Elasticomyces elasticus]
MKFSITSAFLLAAIATLSYAAPVSHISQRATAVEPIIEEVDMTKRGTAGPVEPIIEEVDMTKRGTAGPVEPIIEEVDMTKRGTAVEPIIEEVDVKGRN